MKLYNALAYNGMPADFGNPIVVVYRRGDEPQMPAERIKEKTLQAWKQRCPIILDCEYPQTEYSPLGVDKVLDKLRIDIRVIRECRPLSTVGVYEIPWNFGNQLVNRYSGDKWMASAWEYMYQLGNDLKIEGAQYPYVKTDAKNGLIHQLDLLTPSYYAIPDQPHYFQMVEAMTAVIRRWFPGKPIIPFISPINVINSARWDQGYWRAQLEFIRDNCDGAIIWDGQYGPSANFPTNDPWVKELERWI